MTAGEDAAGPAGPIDTTGAAVLVNPARGGGWTAAMDAILNDAAHARARAVVTGWPGYAPTPLVPLPGLARALGVGVLAYKDEGGRFGLGSFKALGGAYAVWRLLAAAIERATGVVPDPAAVAAGAHRDMAATITVTCATDGNHGRSVAWGAGLFGCPAVIFIHAGVSEGRRAAIERFGARVVRTAGTYDDSVREAEATAAREGWQVVSDTSYPGYREVPKDVMQGYELMAAEALDALDAPPTHVFLQTGVGGMAAAVAALAWRRLGAERPVVVLADPEKAACWWDSLAAGRPVAAGGALDTLQAGLACGEVSELAWEILATGADAVVRVPDDAAVATMRALAAGVAGDRPIVAGESAVAGLAALAALSRDPAACAALGLGPTSRVLVFGTEGDTDPELYARLVGRTGDEVRAAAASWRPAP
ncbi:diaminopropionate ammonia-lyase [Oharaeibacter diazotrophicus]|uniref:Diaminopropionate ammonia-lyase n=2 Tax=Oharaeibacter diazotrophicus TaxID=1920512 RepID=A0A4R6R784_9HYPH|nr:diaminopropionate ammonia-lyase [Oharaeibacter diazotrophicus]TDP81830.1 diaminopropionate ammonia-lyase [Oharaeibacter diazotrophicus]BBE73462.1 diaminopropionate ammonia-lyase [Pleomorphomonas sp. SM30]GLS75252.1 PLP-dependent lyase/thiolase [Oharaeibacter diazotrophicus]